jgi:hypothetical protein
VASGTVAWAIASKAEAYCVAACPSEDVLNAVALLGSAVPKVPDIRDVLARGQARV